ncbi:hypothetical protein BGW80DRAFT_1564889 [Lactifluus volemus]|nr:hypothetical protein BGW80DRAFT_1564889 [Lactifluus volemus]
MGSEVSPAPILQEHREAALRRSQRQNAMIVTRYDSGDDQMVLTAALRNSLSSSQMDPNIQTTMPFSRELSLASLN